MIKTVLFDLDGTLLPMDQKKFVKAYFGSLAKRLAPYGFEPESLSDGIWAGMAAMVKNNGEVLNEVRWWESFDGNFGEKAIKSRGELEAYYREDFDGVRYSCGNNPKAREVIDALKERGLRLVLATNPVFPATATHQRVGWAGLDTGDFELITTYDNSHYCKPNPDYYREILAKIGAKAEECLMVGNDVDEDMIAETLGMKVFLLTYDVLNKYEKDTSVYRQGGFDELLTCIDEICG